MWPLTPLNQALSIAILLLSLALGASMLHGRALKAERDAKTVEIDSMRNAAKTYQDQSVITAKETSDAFTKLVQQIQTKDTAINAARARFGTCNVAGGITAVRVPTEHDHGEARLPESTGGLPTEERVAIDREHINDYAACIGFVKAVHTWRVKNDLPVE